MGYSDLTLKKLFCLSGNMCAFPQCQATIVDSSTGVVVGEICHIKSKSPNGPRYDPNQTEEERNSYENLLLMCDPHNKIVDHRNTRENFPVEVLQKFKSQHEAQFKNAVVDNRLTDHFVSHFVTFGSVTSYHQSGGQLANIIINNAQAREPDVNLEALIESPRVCVGIHPSIDTYDFCVSLHNQGQTTIRDFRVEVRIPTAYSNRPTSTVYAAEVTDEPASTNRLFRVTANQLNNCVLYPGAKRDVLSLDFQVTREQYREGVAGSVLVSAYCGDRVVSKTEQTIAALLRPERVQYFLTN
jgi:hypothetical protein